MSKRTYITTARLTALRSELRPIDWSVIEDVARTNLLSGNQLQRLHYQDSETGRRMARLDLSKLVEREVLARLGRAVGGQRAGSEGFVYALGVAGQRVARSESARPREPWTPSWPIMRHALAVSELYVQLRELERDQGIAIEHYATEPRCWRTFNGPGGSRLIVKPDAYAITANDDYIDSWFIELDRDTESTTRIKEKAKAYTRYWQSGREQSAEGVFPTVLFIVPSEKRKSQIIDVLSHLPPEHWQLFRTVTNDAAIESIASGVLINNDNQQEEVTS